MSAENELEFRTNEAIQPKSSPFSKLKTIVQAMDPPPNCTSLNLDARWFLDDSTGYHRNRLECFLWNLNVEIPEQSFEKGWLTITVHDMMCTNFRLHGLKSNSSVAPLDFFGVESSDVSALRLSVQRVSATCQGKYHSTGGLSGNLQATVSQSSPSLQALDLLVDVQGKQGTNNHKKSSISTVKLPVSFETKECGTSLGCEAIRFSGSISAKMIQAFSGRIGRYITQTLQEQVCPLMTKVADPIVTAYFKEFDDLIQPYLEEDTVMIGTTSDDSIVPSKNNLFDMNKPNTESKNIMEYTVVEKVLSLSTNNFNTIYKMDGFHCHPHLTTKVATDACHRNALTRFVESADGSYPFSDVARIYHCQIIFSILFSRFQKRSGRTERLL